MPLIGKALPSVLSDEDLRADAIHPNASGHDVLAERAFDELARSGVVAAR